MSAVGFKRQVVRAKATAIAHLAQRGIEDTFTVKVKKFSVNDARADNWLGLYRARSQFDHGPIFWINEALPSLIENELVEDQLVDTILHEYGHVIYEFAKMMAGGRRRSAFQALWEDIQAQTTGPAHEAEEEFAEQMGQTLGNGHLVEVYAELAERYGQLLSLP